MGNNLVLFPVRNRRIQNNVLPTKKKKKSQVHWKKCMLSVCLVCFQMLILSLVRHLYWLVTHKVQLLLRILLYSEAGGDYSFDRNRFSSDKQAQRSRLTKIKFFKFRFVNKIQVCWWFVAKSSELPQKCDSHYILGVWILFTALTWSTSTVWR